MKIKFFMFIFIIFIVWNIINKEIKSSPILKSKIVSGTSDIISKTSTGDIDRRTYNIGLKCKIFRIKEDCSEVESFINAIGSEHKIADIIWSANDNYYDAYVTILYY